MSELNNKKSHNGLIIICLIIFTLIAVAITYFAIEYTNKQNEQKLKNEEVKQNIIEEPKKETSLNEKELAVKITDTYDKNPIEINQYWYVDGKIEEAEVLDNDYNFDYTQYEKSGKFVQISGLRDKEVQDKINNEIKAEVIKLINQGKHPYCQVNANFANVLSISINNFDNHESISLNYRLDTGENIQFYELFTDKSYIKTILTQSLYEEIASRYIDTDNLGGDADQKDYSMTEEDCLKIVQSYLNNPNVEFYFRPDIIWVTIDDYSFRIKMENFADYIAIYKRYLEAKNLYETDNSIKGLYVFSDRRTEDCYYYKLQKETDNLFVDIWLFETNESSEESKQETLNNVNSILEQVKAEAQSNLDNGYIFTAYLYVGDEELLDVYKYKMSRDYFDSEGPELIAKCNREFSSENLGVYYNEGQENKNISLEKYYQGEFMTYEEYIEKARQGDAIY